MAAEYLLIPKHKLQHLQQKAEELEKLSVEDLGKKNILDDNIIDNEENVITEPPSTPTTTHIGGNNTSESKVRNNVILKPNGAHVMSNSGNYQFISYNEYDVEDVLKMFDESELVYIHPIVKKMEKNPTTLNWDKETGEIVYELNAISGSNILDLLEDSLTGNINPIGKKEFYSGMSLLNVDGKYIKNFENKHFLYMTQKGLHNYNDDDDDSHAVKLPIKKRKWEDW